MGEHKLPDGLDAFTDARRDALLAMTSKEAGQWFGLSEQSGAMVQETLREIRAQERFLDTN